MDSPFDPATWWRWSTRPSPERGWLDTWLALTTWWVDPTAAAIERVQGIEPGAVLVDIVEGISRRFESQRFEAVVHAIPVSGILESIRLVRNDGVDARLELREVRIADLLFERVSALLPAVGLQLTDDVRLSGSSPMVQLRIELAELLRWLGPRLDSSWTPTVDGSGDLWATHIGRDVVLLVEPAARGESIELVVRAVRLRRRVVRLPRWLHLARTVPLALPGGMRLVGAFASASHVDATVEMQPFDELIDLAQLRDAVARRLTVAIG